jgi:hypothetical protein
MDHFQDRKESALSDNRRFSRSRFFWLRHVEELHCQAVRILGEFVPVGKTMGDRIFVWSDRLYKKHISFVACLLAISQRVRTLEPRFKTRLPERGARRDGGQILERRSFRFSFGDVSMDALSNKLFGIFKEGLKGDAANGETLYCALGYVGGVGLPSKKV